jgi:hypothetical protein
MTLLFGQQTNTGGEGEENQIKKVSQLRASSELELLMYPNPCVGTLYVSCVEGADIRLVNASGMVVSEQKSGGSIPAMISNLLPGVYFCTVIKDELAVTSQIISQ